MIFDCEKKEVGRGIFRFEKTGIKLAKTWGKIRKVSDNERDGTPPSEEDVEEDL